MIEGRHRQASGENIFREIAGKDCSSRVKVPISQVWDFFEKQPKPGERSKWTTKSKCQHLNRWMKWMGEEHDEFRYAREVTERLAAEYMQKVFGDAAGMTWNNNLSSLRNVFSVIRIPARLTLNPWEAIRRRQAQSIRRRDLTPDEVRKIFTRSAEYEARVKNFWPTAIALGYHTGLRWGDVCTLQWREIDFDNECLTLIPKKVKLRKGIQVTPWFHEDFAEPLSKLWKQRGKPQDGLVWPQMAEVHEKMYSWPFTEWREILEHKDVGLKVSRIRNPARSVALKCWSILSTVCGIRT